MVKDHLTDITDHTAAKYRLVLTGSIAKTKQNKTKTIAFNNSTTN